MGQNNLQSRQQRNTMLLEDPISRVIPKMAIPTIIAFMINSIYSMADTYFVSSLGTAATAAVSVNTSLDQLISMGGSLLAVGSNSYIARLLGRGEEKRASNVLSTSFFLAFGLGTLLLMFGLTFMTPLVRLLGATPTCEKYAIDYATYVLFAAPFMASNFVMNQCLRSEGSATLSMVGMGFGGILNCVLDPIFIFYFDMGVAGASLATALSKLVSFGILIFPYITRRSMLHLTPRNFRFDWSMLKEVISVGSSSLFRTGLSVVAAILLNDLAGNLSDSVLASVGVCNKVMMFPFSIILGFSGGFQPVAGFNWGAKRYDRVRESFRFSSTVALVGAIIMAAAVAIFSKQIIITFAGTDPEMRHIGQICMLSQCVALPIHAWVAVVNGYCAGLGNGKGAVALSTARQGTCFIPILYPLAWLFGAYGIAVVQALADILTLVLAFPILSSMKKRVNHVEAESALGE